MQHSPWSRWNVSTDLAAAARCAAARRLRRAPAPVRRAIARHNPEQSTGDWHIPHTNRTRLTLARTPARHQSNAIRNSRNRIVYCFFFVLYALHIHTHAVGRCWPACTCTRQRRRLRSYAPHRMTITTTTTWTTTTTTADALGLCRSSTTTTTKRQESDRRADDSHLHPHTHKNTNTLFTQTNKIYSFHPNFFCGWRFHMTHWA